MRIRAATPDDAAAVHAIYAPVVRDTPISFEFEPPSIEEIRGRITDVLRKYPWLIMERDGRVVGYVYATTHRTRAAYQWGVETAVYIAEEARGQGVGRALYLRLFDVLRRLGYVNAYAGVTLPNPPSVRLHESVGFMPIGVYPGIGWKFGQWHDVGWWRLQLQTPMPNPSPPRVFTPDVLDSAAA